MKSKARSLFSAASVCCLSLAAPLAHAQTFVWTNPATGGDWPTAANWDAAPAFGADVTLDFSTLDLSEENLMYMDADATAGTLRFADTDSSHDWRLNPGFGTTLTLATTTGNPVIQVDNRTVTLEPVIAGSQGFEKTGAGTLVLTAANTLEGSLLLKGGVLSVNADARLGAVPASPVSNSLAFDGGTLRVTAGSQTIHANRGISVSSNGGTVDCSALPDVGNNSVTLAGPISGSTSLQLDCNGDLSPSGGGSFTRMQVTNAANTGFTGGFQIQSGLVEFAGQNAAGSGPITLSAGGGLISAAADYSLASAITVSAGGGTLRCWGGRMLALTGELSGSGALTKTDSGTVVLTGANTDYSGTITIASGILRVGNGGTTGGLGTAAVINNSGLRTLRTDSFTLENNVSGTGTIISDGTGTTTLTGALTSTGVIGVSNGGTLVIKNASTNVGTTSLTGGDSNVTGSLQILAGNVNTRILNFNSGTSSISGGSITTIGQVRIGNTASPNVATFNQTSGSVTVNNAATYLADQNGTGTHNLSGGSYTQAGGTTYLIATRGTGTLNLSDTGQLNTSVLWFGHNSVSGISATVNLDGGVLQTNRIEKPGGVASSIFNFNGGTLRAGANNAYFLGGNNGSTAHTGITRANIRDAGAVIDTNGFSVTMRQPLLVSNVVGDLGTGGLTKQGAGSLTLSAANTYVGATAVNAGALIVDGSLANSAVQVDSTAHLGGNGSLDGNVHILTGGGVSASISDWAGTAGTGFSDLDLAGSLTLDGTIHTIVVQTPGLANFSETNKTFPILNATGGISGFNAADFTVSAPGFSGAGTWSVQKTGNSLELVYSAAAGYAGWIAGFGLTGPNAAFDNDYDLDGLDNGVEFVLGGNPAAGMDAGILPTLEMVATDLGSGPQDYLLFTYRRTDLSAASIASAAQYGTDLSSWNTAVDGVNGVKILIDDNHVFSPPSPNTDRVRVHVPRASHAKLFGRLHITQP